MQTRPGVCWRLKDEAARAYACHEYCKCDRGMNGIEGLGPAPASVEGLSPPPVDGFSPPPVDGFGPPPVAGCCPSPGSGIGPIPVDGFGPISVDGVGPAPDSGFGTTPWELLRGAKSAGFVFCRGGFRCAVQIGVVQALDEMRPRPCLCPAVSAGAGNAAAVAVGNQRGRRRYWRKFMRMPHDDAPNLLREHSPFIFNT